MTRASRMPWRMLLVVSVLASLVTACGSDAPGSGDPASGDRTSFGPDAVNEAVGSLASIGVEIRSLPSDDGPSVAPSGDRSGLKLLRFQVRNMALERSAGAGTLGADLDAAVSAAGGGEAAPLLAGWIRDAGTPAADLARSAVGHQDLVRPATVVFPTIALAAFLADVTRGAEGSTLAAGPPVQMMLMPAGSDLCSQVSTYLGDALQGVVASTELDVPWLAGVIDAYAPAYRDDPDAFRTTVGALAVVAYATSVGRAWTVHANPAPSQVAYSIEGDDPVEGEVLVSMDIGSAAFSEEIEPCAALAGIELEGSAADGATLFWDASGLGAHAHPSEADADLDEEGQGAFSYETTAESRDAAEKGDAQTAQMSVLVIAERQEIDTLLDAVEPILLGPSLGGSAGKTVKDLYAKLRPQLLKLMFPAAVATIDVTFHAQPSPTPTPTPAADVMTGTWEGTWYVDGYDTTGGFTMTVKQRGATFSGTGMFSGPTCVRGVDVTGTVEGAIVRFHTAGIRDLDAVVTINRTSGSGTWEAISCGEPYPMPNTRLTGTWELTKVS